MKICLTVFWFAAIAAALLCANPTLAQTTLYRSNSGTGQTLRSMFFMDDSNGIAVGDSGVLVASTNGGAAWRNFGVVWQSTGTPFLGSLNTEYFNDTLDGSTAGSDGTIFTNIKGQKAIKNVLPGSNPIYGMTFPSYDTGVVCGAGGLFYMTTDSGRTWTQKNVPAAFQNYDFHGTDYFDDDTYWLVGQKGTVLYTETDGAHWQQISVPTTKDLYSIYFPDDGSATGWIVGDSTLLTTTDGGDDWTSLSTTASLRTVEGWDSTDAYAAGLHGQIIFTSNRSNWFPFASGTTANLYGFDYTDDWLYFAGDSGLILTTLPSFANFEVIGPNSSSTVLYGAILDGTDSTNSDAVIENLTSVPVTITSILSDSSEFIIDSGNTTPFIIDSGSVHPIKITFKPPLSPTIQRYSSFLRVTSTEAGEHFVTLAGDGIPQPANVNVTNNIPTTILLTSGNRSAYITSTSAWTGPVKLEIFNVLGASVFSANDLEMNGQTTLPVSLPEGIYFYRLSDGHSGQIGKFSLQ